MNDTKSKLKKIILEEAQKLLNEVSGFGSALPHAGRGRPSGLPSEAQEAKEEHEFRSKRHIPGIAGRNIYKWLERAAAEFFKEETGQEGAKYFNPETGEWDHVYDWTDEGDPIYYKPKTKPPSTAQMNAIAAQSGQKGGWDWRGAHGRAPKPITPGPQSASPFGEFAGTVGPLLIPLPAVGGLGKAGLAASRLGGAGLRTGPEIMALIKAQARKQLRSPDLTPTYSANPRIDINTGRLYTPRVRGTHEIDLPPQDFRSRILRNLEDRAEQARLTVEKSWKNHPARDGAPMEPDTYFRTGGPDDPPQMVDIYRNPSLTQAQKDSYFMNEYGITSREEFIELRSILRDKIIKRDPEATPGGVRQRDEMIDILWPKDHPEAPPRSYERYLRPMPEPTWSGMPRKKPPEKPENLDENKLKEIIKEEYNKLLKESAAQYIWGVKAPYNRVANQYDLRRLSSEKLSKLKL